MASGRGKGGTARDEDAIAEPEACDDLARLDGWSGGGLTSMDMDGSSGSSVLEINVPAIRSRRALSPNFSRRTA